MARRVGFLHHTDNPHLSENEKDFIELTLQELCLQEGKIGWDPKIRYCGVQTNQHCFDCTIEPTDISSGDYVAKAAEYAK
ncbi:MAG TPA: hypothetical protein VI933_03035 [archaeon]|nr:hypothetical protein [archaeon]